MKKTKKIRLGQYFRQLRHESALTVPVILSQVKISPTYLHAIERNERSPRIDKLQRLLQIYNITSVDLKNNVIASDLKYFFLE
ncbi:MAG: helix-turn-helix domain-containing protein [Endomicrobium sp.]|jgi:transcriptional regulator with XRE-family HTH domain|nr:helix-turn-helix domain-containing protein [Endomicrobium sp.]